MITEFKEKLESEHLAIPDLLKKMSDQEFARIAMNGFSEPEEIQNLVLMQILGQAGNTEIGKKHSFGGIKSADDFRQQMPVTNWADYEPFVDRMADGEPDLLFPGKAKVFIVTSGTSGLKPKMVPDSEVGSIAKNMVSRFRQFQLIRNLPGIDRNGFILPLSNISFFPPTKAGIPVAFASGNALTENTNNNPSIRIAFPTVVLLNEDSETRDYLMSRFSLQQQNVVMVVGNNAGRFKFLADFISAHCHEIINDIEHGTLNNSLKTDQRVLEKLTPLLAPDPERAAELRQILDKTGTLLPKDYWSSLNVMVFWISSSVGHYVKDLKTLTPENVKFFDAGYGASEARINIPSKPGDPAGTLSIYTAFYEFLPEEGGKTLLAHEVEDGKTYELIVTTWSGLYRYNMKDIVKVEGFTGKTPNIVFQYKSSDILNITDEKIPASLVHEVIRQVASDLGTNLVQVQIFADLDERRYICYVEPAPETAVLNSGLIEEKAHRQLSKDCMTYNFFSDMQKLLNPLRIVEMKQGWQNHLYEAGIKKTGSATQVKLPVMIREKADPGWIK
ncbi:MAG: GH3 auxin-responsive promoter family protein [Bacteroidetes bacterium]|nr:GH3 auxin-responsive promoter family protein [Bacteroidota bacterium]